MPERFGPATSAVKSEAVTQPFTLQEGLYPLNDYFTFSPEERTSAMAALWLATRHLPTASEYHAARQEGGVGERRMEIRYGYLADAYAQLIDPNFTNDQVGVDSTTAERRARFYGMIRTLTAEQVGTGVRRILRIEAEQQPTPQK